MAEESVTKIPGQLLNNDDIGTGTDREWDKALGVWGGGVLGQTTLLIVQENEDLVYIGINN